MNSKLSLLSLLLAAVVSLCACGGGDVSEFSDEDIPSPVGGGIDGDGVTPSNPGADPLDGEALANLPDVTTGGRIFADPNVLLRLSGSAVAADDATIVATVWTLAQGPQDSVVIPRPNQLVTEVVVPDVEEQTLLVFRLTAVDSQGRVNSASSNVLVTPSPAFARVIGGAVNMGEDSAQFTVKLSAVQASDVSVSYATQDGTATAGRDYENTSGTLVIPAGQLSATVGVPILPASIDRVDQSFSMRISVLASEGQNSSSNVGVMLLRDSPDAEILVPILVEPQALALTLGTAMTPLTLVNLGGGGLSLCEDSGDTTLPTGVSVAVSEDASSCVISGAPQVIQAATLATILAANDFGASSVPLSIAVTTDLPPPALAELVVPTLSQGLPMAPLSLVNTGGGSVTCELAAAVDVAFPAWLAVAPSEDARTCVISGTPTTAGNFAASVTARNVSGSAQIDISFEVQEGLSPPALAALLVPVLELGIPMLPLSLLNSGGGDVSCELSNAVDATFPDWLIVAPSADASTCVLSGTPTALGDATAIVNVSNAAGNASAAVNVEVVAPLALPDLVGLESLQMTAGLAINPFAFTNNGGGELIRCLAGEPGLPTGLILAISEDLSTCVISGTPAEEASLSVSIVAENASGASNEVIVGLEILALPIFPAVADQLLFLTEAEPIIINLSSGSVLQSCSTADALPPGLSLALLRDDAGIPTGCLISGEPSEAAEVADYTIRGTNAAGSADVTLSIEVQNLVESLDLSIGTIDRACAIGVATNGGFASVDWNDGSPPEQIANQNPDAIDPGEAGALAHVFEEQSSALVTLTLSRGLQSLTGFAENACAYFISDTELLGAVNLEVLRLNSADGQLSASMRALANNHPQLRDLEVVRTSSGDGGILFTGLLSELPANIERFVASLGFTLTEDAFLLDLPPSIQELDLQFIGARIGGSIEDLPQALTRLRVADDSDIEGNLSGLRADMSLLSLEGESNVSGNVADINNQGGLSLHLSLISDEQIFATVGTIPLSVTSLILDGNIIIDGSIEDLHADMTRFYMNSDNALIAGDITAVQSNGPLEIVVLGQNTIVGNVSAIPVQIISLELDGENRLTGNIETMHANFERFAVFGVNSISGNIGSIEANNLIELSIGGLNTVADFSEPASWAPANLRILEFSFVGDAGLGFDSDELDALLIYLNSLLPVVSDGVTPASISLARSEDGNVTAASFNAIGELRQKGFNVLVNGENTSAEAL